MFCFKAHGGKAYLVALTCSQSPSRPWTCLCPHQEASCLQGFETLTALNILDVSNNRITALPSLLALTELQVWQGFTMRRAESCRYLNNLACERLLMACVRAHSDF